MAKYRLKSRHAVDPALRRPARVPVLVGTGERAREVVFVGQEVVDFGRKKVPEEIQRHPFLEVVDTAATSEDSELHPDETGTTSGDSSDESSGGDSDETPQKKTASKRRTSKKKTATSGDAE